MLVNFKRISLLLLIFLFIIIINTCESTRDDDYRKTLYVTPEELDSNVNGKTMIFSADTDINGNQRRAKRNTKNDEETSSNIDVKVM